MKATSLVPLPIVRLLFSLILMWLAPFATPQPLPASFVRLEIKPRRIMLDGVEARQQALVDGIRADGSVVDVTDVARFETENSHIVRVDGKGVAHPVEDGQTTLTARLGRLTATVPVTAQNTRKPFVWSFENHVESVLTKQGCNQGICHGAAAGKGGFRLSLRAYDPERDYERLRYEGRGRRLSAVAPTQSLLLQKPSLAVLHLGGLRLKRDTLEYRVLADWIRAGAPGPQANTPHLIALEVTPRERLLRPKETQRLLVTARFSDGHTEDVTHWAKYASNEEGLATVDTTGRVTMRAPGEAAITVWYLGKVTFARLRVPFPNRIDLARYRALSRANFIDDHVNARLAQLRLWPSEPCTDAEFLRRATLDTIGLLPTPEETRAFLADPASNRREKWIEALLARPEFVDRWANVWADLLRVNRDTLGETGMWRFYRWIRESVAQNKPWDRFVREIVTAQGTGAEVGPVQFYRMGNRPEEFSETVSQAFLGIRVQCAHCHNHPHEKWTQADYYRMANFFARVGRKGEGENETVFATDTGDVTHPRLGRPLPPAAFDGPEFALTAPGDRRAFLAGWLTAPQNPYFARAVVNRVWKRFMGRGLVEPVDDMRLTNPATNEPLLQALTQDLIRHHFDLKHLMRTILLSRAYQRSAQPNAANREDDRFYSRCLPRRLPAETLLDVICQVTGRPEKFPGVPRGTHAAALPDTRITSAFLDTFGRPPRQVTCECERNAEPNVAQALHLINAETLNTKISAPEGTLARLLATNASNQTVLDTLYQTCLCRPPSSHEAEVLTRALREAQTAKDPHAARAQVFADLFWALLSGPEFQFNH